MRKISIVSAIALSLALGIASAVPAMADRDGQYWDVDPGDTLSYIGEQTGNSWRDLCEWNRLADCNVIHVDQRISLFPSNGDAPVQSSGEGKYHGETSVETWERLAQCESGGRWHINTGNGYYGGIQFSASTWDAYGGEQFSNNAHQTGKYNQMTVGQRTLEGQGWGAWPHCSREIGMR